MEAPQHEFTPEEIADRGLDNFQHVLFGTMAYLKARDLSVEEWATFLGALFAPEWGHGHGARHFMEKVALNVVSAGAEVRSLSGNDDWAETVVADWPPPGKLASPLFNHYFGLMQEDVDPWWEVLAPIAARLGFVYEWHREAEDKVSFTFSRRT